MLQELIKLLEQHKVIKDNGCWELDWAKDSNGRSRFTYNGKSYNAHRIAAAYYHGLNMDNRIELALYKNECNNPACWNPTHIYVGTYSDNQTDTNKIHESFGQFRARQQLSKTHCKNGHKLDGKNIEGRRYCKTCMRERKRKEREK